MNFLSNASILSVLVPDQQAIQAGHAEAPLGQVVVHQGSN